MSHRFLIQMRNDRNDETKIQFFLLSAKFSVILYASKHMIKGYDIRREKKICGAAALA